MTPKIHRLLFLPLLLVFVLLGGCFRTAPRPIDLHIGVIAMLSGSDLDEQNGVFMSNGAQLAADQANRDVGLAQGKQRVRVRLTMLDDRNNPDGAVDAARRLINVDRVAAIVGPQFSRNAIPVARLADSAHIVMICPMSTNPETTLGKRFVFRIPFLDTFQGQTLARFARQELRASTAAVLYDISNQYNTTLAEVFRGTFTELGGTIAAMETYTSDNAKDFAPQLGRIGAAKPQVLFLPNLQDDTLLQGMQARALGVSAMLLGGDGWDPKALAREKSFEGAYAALSWDPDMPSQRARAFQAAYRAVYRKDPEGVAATTFDAVQLLVEAVRKTGRVDSESLRTTLLTMDPFSGVTGTITFRGSGDPAKSMVLARIAGGVSSVFKVFEQEKER